MGRRSTFPVIFGCLMALAAVPGAAQRADHGVFIFEGEFPDSSTGQQTPVVVTPPPQRPALERRPAQVWKTLAPFKSRAEFDAYRRKARDIARTHGWTWGFLRQRRNDGPLLAQDVPEPCDPAISTCDELTEEVSVTGLRASVTAADSSRASITNNQVASVDEGDIVKAFDRFLVVLMHGRLFSVDTGATAGELRLIDRIDTYQDAKDESWVDEILIYKDTILVTGYSYETDASNIALFRIDAQGRFTFLARYYIESEDYYSWENYATRIVDGKLVIYTPFDLSEYEADEEMPLPRIRRFTEAQGFNDWQPLFDVDSVYRPIQPAIYPSMHVMSVCPIDPRAELRCEARGIVGPWQHEMYVAPDHAYLWLTTDRDEVSTDVDEYCEPGRNVFRKPGLPAALYRMTVSGGALSAVHVEGMPNDQFSLEEKGEKFWALVQRPPLACEALDAEGEEYTPLALLKIDAGEFSTRPRRLPNASYYDMPKLTDDWSQQTRFSERHLMYGGDGARWTRGHGYSQDSWELVVAPLSDPTRSRKLPLTHAVNRIELYGRHAVVFGNQNGDLAVSSVKLAGIPRVADTQIVAGASESEGRSHAFNAHLFEQGDGLFGLPVVFEHEHRGNWRDTPPSVQFFAADRDLKLEDAAQLRGTPQSRVSETEYQCQVSCYDWYGNSRPIFFRGRIFALIGHEVIEGSLKTGRVAESARLSLTGTAEYSR